MTESTPRAEADRRKLVADERQRADIANAESALRQLIADPRYWRDKDPVIIDQVAAGYRALYGAGNEPERHPLTFQNRVHPWLMACFGPMIAGDREERNHRFLEEALELVQACGCTASEAHQLVDYVYGRPTGEPHQGAGGVMVTLAALCLANGLDLHEAGEAELARVWAKKDAIRAKQAAKPKHSPLPQNMPPPGSMISDKFKCLAALNELTTPGEWYVHFRPIVEATDLDRDTVRRHCRALKRAGLASFRHGLIRECDGSFAGAGYCITHAGIKYLKRNDA